MVIWLIGLSASGKTTLGRNIYELWKNEAPNTVFIDGDEIREVFRHDQDDDAYSIDGRRKNAERICELCAWLDRQGINIVCCILSIFEHSRLWNRQNFSKYFEIYLSVPMETLKKREVKGIYDAAFKGEMKNVVGVDIPFEVPESPDYVFDNSKECTDFIYVASDMLRRAKDL